MNTYNIHLPIFDGPFDLLLFFIERDELDIHNIPISQVTNDFLAYITDLENRNLDVASEFILVAATLMRIKAKALLPRKALDEFGKEIDPRLELTQKLLEYKQFKSILEDLRIKEDDMAKVFPRGNTQAEYQQLLARANTENEWESVSLFKLVQAFNRLMKQYEGKETSFEHAIADYQYTIKEQQDSILSRLSHSPASRLDFEELFEGIQNRIHAIVQFLAILELVNSDQISITRGDSVNQFWIKPSDPALEG